MPIMYKKGSEAIVVHPSQIANAEVRGWSLEEKPTEKVTEKETKPKQEHTDEVLENKHKDLFDELFGDKS